MKRKRTVGIDLEKYRRFHDGTFDMERMFREECRKDAPNFQGGLAFIKNVEASLTGYSMHNSTVMAVAIFTALDIARRA